MTATKVNKNVVRIFNSIEFSLALIVSTILVGNVNGQSPKITVYGAIRDKWIAMDAAWDAAPTRNQRTINLR